MIKSLDESDILVLEQERELLLILHHRNKNQHRAAVWFKDLSFLKAALSRILTFETQLMHKKEKKENEQGILEVRKLLDRVPKLYTSFTRIIGTGQYVALGMVLLGSLARIWKILESIFHIESDDDDVSIDLVVEKEEVRDHKVVIVKKDKKVQKKKVRRDAIDDIFG